MTAGIDALRPLSAGRLLAIWREAAEQEPDAAVRGLVCNARVLAESCRRDGEPAFPDGQAVLDALTAREMEGLLQWLAGGPLSPPAGENPGFDEKRYRALRGETG